MCGCVVLDSCSGIDFGVSVGCIYLLFGNLLGVDMFD